jgi:hypothetical protein
MAQAYWDGLSNAIDTGKVFERFSRATASGVPQ